MELQEYKKIFDDHYKPIKHFLYYKLGDVDLAEDLVQEVFLKPWTKRGSIQMGNVQNLLFNFANHLAINHAKSARKRFEFVLGDHEWLTTESAHYTLEKNEFAAHLETAIASLSEKQHLVF